MDELMIEKRKRYRIVQTNAGNIAVQYRVDTIEPDYTSFMMGFRFVETWFFYDDRFDNIKEAELFIGSKIRSEMDSEVKTVIG